MQELKEKVLCEYSLDDHIKNVVREEVSKIVTEEEVPKIIEEITPLINKMIAGIVKKHLNEIGKFMTNKTEEKESIIVEVPDEKVTPELLEQLSFDFERAGEKG